MGDQKAKKTSEEEVLAQAEETLKNLKEHDTKLSKDSLELSTKNVSKKENKVVQKSAKSIRQLANKKPKQRGKKYQEASKLVDRNNFYLVDDALELVNKTSYTKFDSSIELHIRLKAKKGDEGLRGLVELPYKAGKEKKIVVLDEELIEKIAKDGKADYDILIATTQLMPKLTKIAKILGPQGKMPNHKSGTITADPEKVIGEFKKGKIEYRSDKNGIIHQVIGKTSWEKEKVLKNYQVLLAVLPQNRIQSIVISSTMGPGIKVKI